jgi:hypothetical protein
MAINAEKFPNTGESIQVGGMTVKGNASQTFITISANSIIEVADTAGAGAYFKLGTSDPGTISSGTTGAIFIPPYGVTRPFKTGDNTGIRGNAVINVREL